MRHGLHALPFSCFYLFLTVPGQGDATAGCSRRCEWGTRDWDGGEEGQQGGAIVKGRGHMFNSRGLAGVKDARKAMTIVARALKSRAMVEARAPVKSSEAATRMEKGKHLPTTTFKSTMRLHTGSGVGE